MPDIPVSAGGRKRRPPLVWATLLTASVAWAQSRPVEPAPTSRPAARATVSAAYRQLARISTKALSREQIALKTVLEVCLAVGRADGERAAKLLDAVGYQALPLEGALPEHPRKPWSAAEFRDEVARRQPVRTGDVPVDSFEVVARAALRREFPAVATWMSARDLAVVIRPAKEIGPGWVSRSCCVVVRLRARRPTIVAGNLLAALSRPTTRRGASAP